MVTKGMVTKGMEKHKSDKLGRRHFSKKAVKKGLNVFESPNLWFLI